MPKASNVGKRRAVAAKSTAPAEHSAPRFKLLPNVSKIIEAIAFVIAESERRSQHLTQYDILKALFLADRSHLNRYGRPVIFDDYYAMKDGPVPSLAYNLLKEDKRTFSKYKLTKLPWKRSDKEPGSGRYYYSKAKDVVDDDVLSPSDIRALADSLATINSLTFPQIRKLTHNDSAYIEAWKDEGLKKAHLMSYGMLFDSPDFEAAETILFLSEQR